jgi:hypothetical protein
LETQKLITLACVYLVHADGANFMVHRLMSKLRSYQHDIPDMPNEFKKETQYLTINDEKSKPTEEAAGELICSLLFDCGHLFKMYFPMLLQNYCVLLQSVRKVPEALAMCGVWNNIASSRTQTTFTPAQMVVEVAKHCPDLALVWCRIALCWVLTSADPRVRQKSLEIVYHLQQSGGYPWFQGQNIAGRLLLNLYLTIRLEKTIQDTDKEKEKERKLENFEVINWLVKLLARPSDVSKLDGDGYRAILYAGFCLLCRSQVLHFSKGLSLVKEMLFYGADDLRSQWLLGIGFSPDPQSDVFKSAQYLASLLSKGLVCKDTDNNTLVVLERLATAFADLLPLNNRLVILQFFSTVFLLGMFLAENDTRSEEAFFVRISSCLGMANNLRRYISQDLTAKVKEALKDTASALEDVALQLYIVLKGLNANYFAPCPEPDTRLRQAVRAGWDFLFLFGLCSSWCQILCLLLMINRSLEQLGNCQRIPTSLPILGSL